MNRLVSRIAACIITLLALTLVTASFMACENPAGNGPTPVDIIYTASANGIEAAESTSILSFTFDRAVTGLRAENIILTDGSGVATKGSLSGYGKDWTLGLIVSAAGTVQVSINKAGIEVEEKTVTVYKEGEQPLVAYSVMADGEANTTTSTKIEFNFEEALDGLSAADISLESGTGSVTKGELSGGETSWELAITVHNPGSVTVTINKPGIENTGKTAMVHMAGEPSIVDYSLAVNSTTTSTQILFTFDGPVVGLSAADINLESGTGSVTKGGLSGAETGWGLAIIVQTPGDIKVTINKLGIAGEEKTVAVYKGEVITYTMILDGNNGVTGSEGTPFTLEFTFDQPVAGLTTDDITISGQPDGTVTMDGLYGDDEGSLIWRLDMTLTISTPVNVTVTVKKTGVENVPKPLGLYKLTWTASTQSVFNSNQINGICYGGSSGDERFVAVADRGKMAYSLDGVTWTAITTSVFGTGTGALSIYSVAYGNGRFIAASSSKIAYSEDNGVTWTLIASHPFDTIITRMAFGNGVFVAAGYTSSSREVGYSTDGQTWTLVDGITGGVTFGGGKFVAFGGGLAYSDDGMTWTQVEAAGRPFGAGSIGGVAYGNGRFVAYGGSGMTAYSDDEGATWTLGGTPPVSARFVAYGAGRFLAGSSSTKIHSENGEAWVNGGTSGFGSSYNMVTAAYGAGRFVIVGSSGRVAYSNLQE
jgi:hypothetical protein